MCDFAAKLILAKRPEVTFEGPLLEMYAWEPPLFILVSPKGQLCITINMKIHSEGYIVNFRRPIPPPDNLVWPLYRALRKAVKDRFFQLNLIPRHEITIPQPKISQNIDFQGNVDDSPEPCNRAHNPGKCPYDFFVKDSDFKN